MNWALLIVTVCPIGSPVNSSLAVVDPRTATVLPAAWSASVKNRPSVTVRARTVSHVGVVPDDR